MVVLMPSQHATPPGSSRPPPRRIAVDLQMLGPGGMNGGIKPTIFAQLHDVAAGFPGQFEFCFFVNREIAPELSRAFPDSTVRVISRRSAPLAVRPGARVGMLARWWLRSCDALYAPVWYSPLHDARRRTVTLLVDMLHRDLPEMLSGDEERRWRETIIRESTRTAFRIQCISHFMAGRVREYYGVPNDRVFVTHLPLQHRIVPAVNSSVAGTRPYFIYPANAWPHKNHERLISAFAEYCGRGGGWELVLTGFDPNHPRVAVWRQHAEQAGIPKGVLHFRGHLDTETYSAVLRAAGALVFPSLYEGFGMPVLEAMTHGVPVATSTAAALPEVVGEAGLLFDPLDPHSIAETLWTLSSRADVRESLRARGYARAGEFSARAEADKLARALAEAAGRPLDVAGSGNV